jgi:hypothetical protein
MNEIAPAAQRTLKALEDADGPLHIGDLLRETGCSIDNLLNSLSLLTRLDLIVRADIGGLPYWELGPKGPALHLVTG